MIEKVQAVDPEKSCMYPLRDWVTCVEGCVIFPHFIFLKLLFFEFQLIIGATKNS
jgi:hypothetical protein